MREGWEMKRLSEVCDIRPPKKIAKEKIGQTELVSFVPMSYLSTNKKYFSSPETKTLEKAYSGYVYFENNDVILAKITPCFENGKLGIAKDLVNGIGFGSSEYVVYRVKNYLIPEFLYYYLNQESFRKVGKSLMTGAVGHKRIPKEFYEQYKIPIPPLAEQLQIVALLDAAFAKIDQAKANIEKNIENAKELLDSYMQDTFRANVEGNNSCTLNEICELIVDCEHKTAPTQDTGFPSIRTPNIGFGELILDNVKRVSEEVYNKWTRRAIPMPGDLILAREAPAGNIGVIPKDTYVCLGQRTVLIRPQKDKFISKYLAYLILSKDVQKRLLSHSQGATVGHINMRDIRAFKIFNLPSLEEQRKVVSKVENILRETNLSETIYLNKLNNLQELKKSLLQRAFAGELTSIDSVNTQIPVES